jgi:superfamily II DNA/RNA helicase
VRLDGSVPQVKRQRLVEYFQRDPSCKVFLTTNAGSTGLNLQAAGTVINMDLPWNPAVLKQRIARAHRMGQRRPVTVCVLVTEGMLEEGMLSTLSAKKDLALAVLDPDSRAKEVRVAGSIEELKRRLELLIGQKPPFPVDESEKSRVEGERGKAGRKESVARAGGELLSAAFVSEIVGFPDDERDADSRARLKGVLSACMERAEDGGGE